jgi:hypothetical protein
MPRRQVLKFRTMYILADLAVDGDEPHSHDALLVSIKVVRA